MAENPKVFISYSHDSPEHKQWVSELAARLRHSGVDATLDQWDLGLGDDITRFMERGIVGADKVLVICTDKYVSKANADEGGVGYERMIVNAELVQNLGTDKFIPIIRQASGKEKTPTFLGTRVYADFRNDNQFDAECEKLIRELHELPIIEKPPLGKNPFPSAELDPQLIEIPEEVKSASVTYTTASKLVRAGDTLGWRELIKQIRPNAFKHLVQWRQDELDGQKPESKEQLVQIVDKAVEIISPLMVIALVGVESGREEFRDQKSLFDDLQNIVGWNPAGYDVWIRLPNALGYVYHSLHGGISLSTNQIELALDLARVKIPVAGGTKFFHLWEMGEFRGYAESISGTRGGHSLESWNYLVNAYERWEWLSNIFEDEQDYRTSLVAYYMALNIHELATIIAAGRADILNTTSEPYFIIPLTFLYEDYDTTRQAISLLRRNPNSIVNLWTSLNVKREQVESLWKKWIDLSERALIRSMSPNQITLLNLSDLYQYFFEGM